MPQSQHQKILGGLLVQQYRPAYYQPPAKGNGFGVAALVIGIVGLVISVIPILGFAAFILGPIAIIFGIVGVVQTHRPKGMAVTGMVLGLISIIVSAVITTAFFGAMGSDEGEVASQPAESGAPSNPAATEAGPGVLAVEATQLLEEFDANEASADVKYAGKVLEVTGNVNGVDTEFLDDTKYVVQLDDGSEFSFATVNCNDVPTDQAAAVTPDSTITIRGNFDDGGDLGIELNDCVVL